MKKIFLCLLSVLVNISNIYSQIIPENRFKFLTNIGLEFERPSEYTHVIDVCASPYFLIQDENSDTTSNWKSQNNYIKAGIGFYSLYENNILKGRERNISFYPGFSFGLGFSWEVNSSFYLTWENSIRSKVYRVEFIGLDTTINKIAIANYANFSFINIDSKAMAKIGLVNLEEVILSAVGGLGITINLTEYVNYSDYNNYNVVLKFSDKIPPETPKLLNNSGIVAEFGIEAIYKNISFALNLLIEINQAYLFNVGDNKSILTSTNILYNF